VVLLHVVLKAKHPDENNVLSAKKSSISLIVFNVKNVVFVSYNLA
jgi:hypothetical protein